MFKRILSLLFLLSVLTGCSGVQTYPNVAQAGDTISLAMGWQKRFKRSNTTVTITPSIGVPIIYLPDDPAVRAIINLYPDPLSNIVVGTRIENNESYKYGLTYGRLINTNYTDGDMDWWQTVAFLNLPSSMPAGEVDIELTNDQGDTVSSIVNIVDGPGSAELFNVEGNGPLDSNQLASLERASNFEVSIESAVIPYAIEMEFTHIGKTYIVNPSALKNIIWSDNNSVLKVALLPASSAPLTSLHDFKFYITGNTALDWVQDIQPLVLQSIKAFDINGDIIPGVNASIVTEFN